MGTGERTLFVPEELVRDEVLQNVAGMNGDERAYMTPASGVKRAGDEVLAGAGFADDQDRSRCRCDLADAVEDALHDGGSAERTPSNATPASSPASSVSLTPSEFSSSRARAMSLIGIQRLLEVVIGAFFERFHRVMNQSAAVTRMMGRSSSRRRTSRIKSIPLAHPAGNCNQ